MLARLDEPEPFVDASGDLGKDGSGIGVLQFGRLRAGITGMSPKVGECRRKSTDGAVPNYYFCSLLSNGSLKLIQCYPNVINKFWSKSIICTSSVSYLPYDFPLLSVKIIVSDVSDVLLRIIPQIDI